LYLATDGNYYGATGFGGANETQCPADGCGTLFQVNPSGSFTTLYSFCSQANCADGWGDIYDGTAIQGSNGVLFGSTGAGGPDKIHGLIYELTPSVTLPAPVQLTFSDSTVTQATPSRSTGAY
jgi:uncharacterized repeat protein (TIGR03803 family)